MSGRRDPVKYARAVDAVVSSAPIPPAEETSSVECVPYYESLIPTMMCATHHRRISDRTSRCAGYVHDGAGS